MSPFHAVQLLVLLVSQVTLVELLQVAVETVVVAQAVADIVLDSPDTESVLALFWFVDRLTFYMMADAVQRALVLLAIYSVFILNYVRYGS